MHTYIHYNCIFYLDKTEAKKKNNSFGRLFSVLLTKMLCAQIGHILTLLVKAIQMLRS